MSWGNTASGTAVQVKEQAARFAAQVAANDESYRASEGTQAAHQGQARAVEQAIGVLVDSYPAGAVFSISVSASVAEGSVSCYLNLGYNVAIPAAQG